MPLICDPAFLPSARSSSNSQPTENSRPSSRRQSQQSDIAKSVLLSNANQPARFANTAHGDQSAFTSDLNDTLGQNLANGNMSHQHSQSHPRSSLSSSSSPVSSPRPDAADSNGNGMMQPPPRPLPVQHLPSAYGGPGRSEARHPSSTQSMNDTPAVTAPNSPRLSPRLLPVRQNSGSSTPRVRPTTLDIPGLTKSKVSPDGRIAKRDVGAKLVIIMVGLPARGKSYITKKLARYLNWLQHDTKIFNVGERRRVAAGGPNTLDKTKSHQSAPSMSLLLGRPALIDHKEHLGRSGLMTQITLNDNAIDDTPSTSRKSSIVPDAQGGNAVDGHEGPDDDFPDLTKVSTPMDEESEQMDQGASFFDPSNKRAALIREQCAMDTLDELLEYILEGNGSVGILDATNSTLERRKVIMKRIREVAGPELGVLFLESRCVDETLLESNMRLKLSGPDYKDKDPVKSLEDFKKRVAIYEKNYVPLGEYEEKNDMPYIQILDVGRKIISHQLEGFLSVETNYYFLNFNLAPRQIWITRHGLSEDNVSGKIGGDSDLSAEGEQYAKSLTHFITYQRNLWDQKQLHKLANSHFPPQPGDSTPPNPHYQPNDNNELEQKSFCVWTSMLKRSVQTAKYFDEEDFDMKQWRMLDELHAGNMEGHTYASIAQEYPGEYQLRKQDKLHYRYPGQGGEGYLDIINRLRQIIVELERMKDHCLIVGHRSVSRVLLAYFRGLKREEVADLDVPIGMLYCLEPKPYGVDFKAYKWDKKSEWFYEQKDFELKRAEDDMQ